MANVIRKLAVTTEQLRTFLEKLCSESAIKHAFELESWCYSHRSIYRLYQQLKRREPFIRTRLMQLSQPPPIPEAGNPLLQTVEHLKAAFGDAACPIAAFQHHFQDSFL